MFALVNTAILSIVFAVVLYPCYLVVISSFSNPLEVVAGHVMLLPRKVSLDGYRMVIRDPTIWSGYRNTVFYTAVGTCINVAMTILAAFPLSRPRLRGKNVLMTLVLATMFFGGGLIPVYLLVHSLGMIDSVFAMLIPGAVSVWNIIITKTFMQKTIPAELEESAFMDGCSHTRLLLSIILPLSKPVLAVITLYYAVGHWNSFFPALIYLRSKNLYPLQLVLRSILVQNQMSENMVLEIDSVVSRQLVAEQIKYALIIVATMPVIAVYPLLQRYFVKGIMIGALKG